MNIHVDIRRDAARAAGVSLAGLESVAEVFEQQLETELHPGAKLTVRRGGEIVLDAHGGRMSSAPDAAPVDDYTLFLIFSATKPLTAFAIHLLAERGQLDLDAPVARVWPEFGQRGKEAATIVHVLSHQGGFPIGPRWLTWDLWRDRASVARAMEERTARWEPGTDVGYHPLNYGWALGEIVRRVDGRSLGRFLADELFGPLGMRDTWLGLPPEMDSRVAHHADLSGEFPFVADFNRPEVHAAEAGAATGITTTRDLTLFYSMLLAGGEWEGRRYLRRETLERAVRPVVDGARDRTLEVPVRWALGFHLGGPTSAFGRRSSPLAFGHSGHGSTTGWADPTRGIAVAYFTNGVRGSIDNYLRMTRLCDPILAACDD
ncbi:MAG: serine hydrolase domain-containing protein [Alphaproteobacteria bacterium]